MEIKGQCPLSVRPTQRPCRQSFRQSFRQRKEDQLHPPDSKKSKLQSQAGKPALLPTLLLIGPLEGYILVPLTPALSLGELVVTHKFCCWTPGQFCLHAKTAALLSRRDRARAIGCRLSE